MNPSRAHVIAPLLLAAIAGLAPMAARAQQQVMDPPTVELPTAQATQPAESRSAFGRVMDVMISALIAQQAKPRHEATATLRPATLAAPNKPKATPAPQIEVTLGGDFALPPSSAAMVASGPGD